MSALAMTFSFVFATSAAFRYGNDQNWCFSAFASLFFMLLAIYIEQSKGNLK